MPQLIHSDIVPISLSLPQINEAITKDKGKFIVKTVLQRANCKNGNKRFYSKELLEKVMEGYKEGPVKEKRAYGELDHTTEEVVNLKNACLNVMDIWWEGDDIYGLLEILNTPSGKIVQELLRSGLNVGISSRGTGSLTQVDEESTEVNDDYQLICFDCVSNPSTPGAYMKQLNESKEIINRYSKIDDIVSDILCTNLGFCSCQLK